MFKSEYAEANGLRLHYVSEGEGQLVLFLHGFPEFWYAWKMQLAEFGKDHRAVALDLPGYNLSDKPSDVSEYTVAKIAAAVHALARQISKDANFVLVGHDWGGFIAWALAIAHPEDLEKLVIINAPHPGIFVQLLRADPDQKKASEYMGMFRSTRAEEILSANDFDILANRIMAFGKERGAAAEDRAEYIKAWSQPGAITGGLNYYRAGNLAAQQAADITGASGSFTVNVPTLVIWGMKDPAMVAKNLEGLEQYVPQLGIERIPDASHWVVHTHSAQVNSYIRAFLR